jgi:glycerol-3-phosphate cytidylyltransferase
LCHAGHILAFEESKKNCDRLIVGLHSNPHLDRTHKNVPILSMEERRIILSSIKWIDAIYEYDTEKQLVDLVKTIHPDIYFIGEDWEHKEFSAKKTCEQLGIKVHYLARNHSFSSSNLRQKIYEAERDLLTSHFKV